MCCDRRHVLNYYKNMSLRLHPKALNGFELYILSDAPRHGVDFLLELLHGFPGVQHMPWHTLTYESILDWTKIGSRSVAYLHLHPFSEE